MLGLVVGDAVVGDGVVAGPAVVVVVVPQQAQAGGLSLWGKVQKGGLIQSPTSSGLSAPSGPLKVTPQEDMLPDHLSKESAALLESQLILEVQAEPQSKLPLSV